MSTAQAVKIGPDEIMAVSLNPLRRGGCVAIVTTGSGARRFLTIGGGAHPSMFTATADWWRTHRDLFQPIEQWPYGQSDMVNNGQPGGWPVY